MVRRLSFIKKCWTHHNAKCENDVSFFILFLHVPKLGEAFFDCLVSLGVIGDIL